MHNGGESRAYLCDDFQRMRKCVGMKLDKRDVVGEDTMVGVKSEIWAT